MASSFVKLSSGKSKRKDFFGRPKVERVFFQFVPGIVLDVVTNAESAAYGKKPRNINAIVAKPHMGEKKPLNKGTVNTLYYPLLRAMVDVPTKGDPVLLCSFGGVNYYLGPVNTRNSPNFNPDHLNKPEMNLAKFFSSAKNKAQTIWEKMGLSNNFGITGVNRLQKPFNKDLDGPTKSLKDIHGDLHLEGRHGNSIRIGSRSVNPYIFISNGRQVTNTVESIYDGTIISITEKGTLSQHFPNEYRQEGEGDDLQMIPNPFVLGSDSVDKAKRMIGANNYNYDFDGPQLLTNSDKITINAKQDSLVLSSFGTTFIGSGNTVEIISNKSTTIESSNIYLGKGASEPMVLGKELKTVLEGLIDAIGQCFVGGTIGGVSTPISAGGSPGWTQLSTKIKTDLAKILSDKHYVEKNGSK